MVPPDPPSPPWPPGALQVSRTALRKSNSTDGPHVRADRYVQLTLMLRGEVEDTMLRQSARQNLFTFMHYYM